MSLLCDSVFHGPISKYRYILELMVLFEKKKYNYMVYEIKNLHPKIEFPETSILAPKKKTAQNICI
jgi:hypothetical protein